MVAQMGFNSTGDLPLSMLDDVSTDVVFTDNDDDEDVVNVDVDLMTDIGVDEMEGEDI